MSDTQQKRMKLNMESFDHIKPKYRLQIKLLQIVKQNPVILKHKPAQIFQMDEMFKNAYLSSNDGLQAFFIQSAKIFVRAVKIQFCFFNSLQRFYMLFFIDDKTTMDLNKTNTKADSRLKIICSMKLKTKQKVILKYATQAFSIHFL